LKLFGHELKATRKLALTPGRALELLPEAELPEDLQWAKANPRVADAIARWTAAVEKEGAKVISPKARKHIIKALNNWQGELMPLDISWVDNEIASLEGEDRAIARLAIVVGKASYRITEEMVQDVLGEAKDEQRFIRILAWSSFSAARRFSRILVQKINAAKVLSIGERAA